MLGIRVAHALQIPSTTIQKFADIKGNVTTINIVTDKIASGNYLTSAGKQGDSAWSTRGIWCKMYGKIGKDSITIAIIDHPGNPNYPTFWHARGYGLFAANPLAEEVFTNGKSHFNLKLTKGQNVKFYYRIVIADGSRSVDADQLNKIAKEFAKTTPQGLDLRTK